MLPKKSTQPQALGGGAVAVLLNPGVLYQFSPICPLCPDLPEKHKNTFSWNREVVFTAVVLFSNCYRLVLYCGFIILYFSVFLLLVCIIYYRKVPLVISGSRILKQCVSAPFQPEKENAPFQHPLSPCLV